MSARALLFAVVLLAACRADEPDTPDTTTPRYGDCSGELATDPCVTPATAATTETEPSTSSAATSTSSTAAPLTVPPSPPSTCGPDADEQHPPPCD